MAMREERLLSGYVLRVSQLRQSWRITLQNLHTGQQQHFDSFKALQEYLEASVQEQLRK